MTRAQRNALWALRIGALALAVFSIAFGAARGETAVVLRKAVRICLECIGVA